MSRPFESYDIREAMNLFREGPRRMIRNEKMKSLTKDQVNLLLADSYFNGENYLRLFTYNNRSRLEDAMIIYACHIKYLLAKYDLAEEQLWSHKKGLPSITSIIFRKAADQAHCKSYNRPSIINHVDSVNHQLKEIFSTGLEPKTFSLAIGEPYYGIN